MQAHIDQANNSISITWNINAQSKYDKMSKEQLMSKNLKGWALSHSKILAKVQKAKFLE
jgi:hypothetical protein